MIRKFLMVAAALLTLGLAQGPVLAQQYGPPSSGSSAAILFTPATVNLVAGLNGQGSSGNGGLATAAKLYYPVGLAYDSSGNLFFADGQNYVVRRIDHVTQDISVFAGTSGTFGDSLGGGVATSAQLGILAGLVIDTSNNVYVSDRSNNVVWKITPGGTISLYAGSGSSGLGDGGPATSGKLNNPWALGIDASNNIYISDSYDDLVREVNYSTNVITTFAGVVADAAGGFGSCSAGSLYSTSTPPYLPTQAHLCFPQGVAFDSSGNAYIVDISNHIVRVVNHSTGYISTFAGGGTQAASVNGIPATSASLSPSGVYVDPANRVYIADSGGSLIRAVDSSGNINTVFGNGFEGMAGSIGLPDTEATVNNVGPADGIDDMTMDIYGNLIATDSSGEAITSAATSGQYIFPQTAIFTTKTTTQANATSPFYPPYLTISNPSGVTLTFTGTPSVTGPFAIVTGTGAGTCVFPGSLAPGASCTVVLSFTPTLGGSPGTLQTGSIVLTSNANSSPSTISLSGTGTGVATVSATVTPSPLTYTSQAGVTSAAQQATLTNTGQIPIAVGSTAFNGASAGDFAVSATTCPTGAATLAVGATCTYSITFTPPSATTFQAGFQVCISTSSYGCIQSITLQGTGTAAPTATLLPTPLAFGSVVQGQTSAPMSATLTNTSGVALNISSFTIAGTNPADFAVSTGTNACGSTLAAGASCFVYVTFAPAATTGFSAQLSVADNAAGSPQTVSLTGTGLAPSVAPPPLVFNPAPVGVSLASAQTLTAIFQVNGFGAGFTPTAKLHYGLSYSIGAVSCTGTAGSESCSVPVTFQPQYPGGRREALFLMNGTTRLSSVLIYGIGQGPFALVQPGVVTNPILNNANYLYTSIVDENGTAYVLGDNSNTVYTVTKAGVVGTLPITGLNSPREVGIDGAGILYIADQTFKGPTITWDTVQNLQGSVPFPASIYVQGIAVGNTGNLYETDAANLYTVPISGSGTAATTAINPAITQGYILAVDSNENIFVSGYAINEITSGGVQTQVNTNGASDGLGVDAAGTLYGSRYSFSGSSSVAELPASGYSAAIAELDPPASPLGNSVAPDGTVYVGNYNNLDKVDRSQGIVAFGQIGATASQNVSLYNGGNQPLTITNIAISGAGFTFAPASTSPCTLNVAMAPGTLCQVTVTLTTPHAGTFTGSLVFTNNSLNSASSTQTVALSGASYGIYVTASPTSLTFGNQTIGTTSAAQTITLTNNGELYNATISPVSGSAPFTVAAGTCTTPLAPGASCNLSVTFSPTTPTVYTNTAIGLSATSNGGGPAQSFGITVSGTGVSASAPQLVLNPTSLSFGNQQLTTTSSPLTVTVSNPGTATLNITSAPVTGANISDFTETGSTCQTQLAAGANCTFSFTFSPLATGARSAALTFNDNATGSPQSLPLLGTGTAAPAPQAVLAPAGLTFPSTTVATTSAIQTLSLSNPGNATLNITSIVIAGANPSDFAQTNTCGTSLAASASCTISVTFTPASAISFAATVLVSDNAATSQQSSTLAGTGTAALAPQASLTPTTLTFPSTLVGTSASTLSTTLSNPGTAALTITGISVTGANASSFSQTNTCGASLAVGANCTIIVKFTPASAGNLSATLSITDNATGSPQTAALTGTGIAPQAVLSPNPLAFPATLVSTAATPLPMTLSNPGTAPLTITSISVTGTNASSFGQTNNCGASLAAGASCTITVTFTPASAAALTAAISVADSASGSPHSAALTGTGTPPLIPQAVLSPNPLGFPSTTINTPATPLPMTLSNPGNTPLTITSITVTGANAGNFGETNNCGATLAAGASCTITVSFTPTSAATLTAAISVADNAAGSPQSATITGIGSAGTYVVNSSTTSVTVQPGAVAQFNLVVAPLGGSFNNLVNLSATGLPAGATVSFLPPAVTPGSAGAPSVMSIQTATGLARLTTPQPQRPNSVPLLAIFVGVPLVGLAGSLRRLRRSRGRWMLLGLAALAILPALALSGCGGGYFGPAPQTYSVTVTGTSGSLQESTTISLTVQ